MRALAVRELADRRDRIVRPRARSPRARRTRARASQRSGDTSSAITRAPIATASCVADKPTGPWPKIAIVSPPCRLRRRSAPIGRAGAAGDRRAGLEGKRVGQRHERRTGTFMYRACAPLPSEPNTVAPFEAHLRPAGAAMLAGRRSRRSGGPSRAGRCAPPFRSRPLPTATTTPQGSCPAITGSAPRASPDVVSPGLKLAR